MPQTHKSDHQPFAPTGSHKPSSQTIQILSETEQSSSKTGQTTP